MDKKWYKSNVKKDYKYHYLRILNLYILIVIIFENENKKGRSCFGKIILFYLTIKYSYRIL